MNHKWFLDFFPFLTCELPVYPECHSVSKMIFTANMYLTSSWWCYKFKHRYQNFFKHFFKRKIKEMFYFLHNSIKGIKLGKIYQINHDVVMDLASKRHSAFSEYILALRLAYFDNFYWFFIFFLSWTRIHVNWNRT